jgi:hypothetical protein
MAPRSRAKRSRPARKLDLEIRVRGRSIASLEWGCAYAFPVKPGLSIPLIVVSDLYQSPRAAGGRASR